jgi:hypothetical protein
MPCAAQTPGAAVNTEVPVRCTAARYHLSAHADGDEPAVLAARLRPHLTLLGTGRRPHGPPWARRSPLRAWRCACPRTGRPWTCRCSARTVAAARQADPSAEDLVQRARFAGTRRAWSAVELAERWWGAATAEGVEQVRTLPFTANRCWPRPLPPSPPCCGPGSIRRTGGWNYGSASRGWRSGGTRTRWRGCVGAAAGPSPCGPRPTQGRCIGLLDLNGTAREAPSTPGQARGGPRVEQRVRPLLDGLQTWAGRPCGAADRPGPGGACRRGEGAASPGTEGARYRPTSTPRRHRQMDSRSGAS